MVQERKNISILEIPDDTGYWLLRADGGKYYDDFFLNNFVAISDNEITLQKIREEKGESIAGITTDHYKNLYNENYQEWSNQQVAHAAGRTQKFCDEINIGDLVLVPSRSSTMFLLGRVESDVYEITEEQKTPNKEVHYPINPFLKRRKVTWIKEVKRSEISDKLYWILSAHQTIFDLQKERNYVNQLLAPIFIQGKQCHGSLKISKNEGLSSDEWYYLHSTIKKFTDKTTDEVIIKSNVQSPGIIEFLSSDTLTIVSTVLTLSGLVIGDVSIGGVKLKGIVPYIQSYKKEKIEMGIKEEEKKSKELENERARFELEKDKQVWEKQQKKETEAARLHEELQISMFDAGRIIEGQTQMDTLENPDEDRP
ncbi:hypothetical protein [Oceanobacillus kimchii]|uniref:hypothetical protein n=1 Tax=Oceanobacillus kimchii TaxID=746691 RepID=UPI003B010832